VDERPVTLCVNRPLYRLIVLNQLLQVFFGCLHVKRAAGPRCRGFSARPPASCRLPPLTAKAALGG